MITGMNARFRLVAALLALVAFSAYFAEGVLVAFCAPESSGHAEMAMDAPHVLHGESHGAAGHEMPAEGANAPHCPVGMGGGGGTTCVAASLPGLVIAVEPSLAGSEGQFMPQQLTLALLLVRALYHPPRA
jgi:hypothetical protein